MKPFLLVLIAWYASAVTTYGQSAPGRIPTPNSSDIICRSHANGSEVLAPGMLVICTGREFPLRSQSAHIGDPPYELGGVRVTVGGVPARVRHVSSNQFVVALPDALPVGDEMRWFRIVFRINLRDYPSQAPFVIASPGLSEQRGNPQGFVQTAENRVFVIGNEPIPPGSRIVLVGTGMRYASLIAVNLGLDWIPIEPAPIPYLAGMDIFGFQLPEWVHGEVRIRVSTPTRDSNEVVLKDIQ